MVRHDTLKNMHVFNTDIAWHFIERRTNGMKFSLDENRTERAGYPIFSSDNFYCYVCYLNDRLELNIDGDSINFWIEKTDEVKASNIIDIVYHSCIDTNDFTMFDTLSEHGLVDDFGLMYTGYKVSKALGQC